MIVIRTSRNCPYLRRLKVPLYAISLTTLTQMDYKTDLASAALTGNAF